MATKSTKINNKLTTTIRFLFIIIGFLLLGSQQLHGQFYLLSILGTLMMLFGIFGINKKPNTTFRD